MSKTSIFACHESEVRSYCRRFPTVFRKALGSILYDDSGCEYVDFLAGAGAINYGHNNKLLMNDVISYIEGDGILMSLDLHTEAKAQFIEAFQKSILEPRNLHYKMQFTGPTGTSVIESAVKLARKYNNRDNVFAFTNGFHGMSAASLSLTGSKFHRQVVTQGGVTRIPFDGYLGHKFDSVSFMRKLLTDSSSGVDLPAAVVVETVQGEGGVNVASNQWLQDLRSLCYEFEILMIVDDVQAGCGRCGRFFSFERAEIVPDIVCLSKSIGAVGLPLAVMLLNPALDVWQAGEDNGTFRGNNLAFIAASAMLKHYWNGTGFQNQIQQKSTLVFDFVQNLAQRYPEAIADVRGVGLMVGIEFNKSDHVLEIIQECFRNGLIIESCGSDDQVLKLMPALTIEPEVLRKGLAIIASAMAAIIEH